MTDQQILTKAIEKAIDGGWNTNRRAEALADSIINDSTYDQLEPLIYNPQFAKALWPWRDDSKCPYCDIAFPGSLMHPRPCPLADGFFPFLWQYHLQQMVIAEDPIKYLGENI